MVGEAQTPPWRVSPQHTLAALVGVALLARLAAVLLLGGGTFRFVDEAIYADGAERLLNGAPVRGAAADVPGYTAYLALLLLLLPDGVLPLRIGQACVAALGALLCHRLAHRLGGEAAGLVAAAVFALDPLLVVSAGLLYPDAPAGLLLAGALLAAWAALERDRTRELVVAGALLGMATLFRPVSLALLPAMAGWVALAPCRSLGRRVGRTGVLLLAWGIVIAPWLYGNQQRYGGPLPAGAVAVRGTPGVGADADDRGVVGALVSSATRDPLGFAGRTLREFGHFWELYPTRLATDNAARRIELAGQDPRLSTAPLVQRSARDLVSAVSFGLELALAAVGLLVGWRRRRRATVWLLAVVLSFALGYALFHGKLRYRIPILPIVVAYSGVGAAALLARGRPAQRGPVSGSPAARSHQ